MTGLRVVLLAALAWAGVQPARAADGAQAQGVVQGAEEALLSSEMAGRILSIVEEGASFRKGEALVDFSCDALRAEEDEARAVEKGARAKLDNQRYLESIKTAGKLDLALAEAQVAEAQAKIRAAGAKARLCRVSAPYDGSVLKREARAHESVNVLTPLLRIARKGHLEITVIVPAAWLPRLKVGTPFSFAAAATGEQAEGRVSRLAGSVDSSSQTAEIRGELVSEPRPGLKPGMAGTVLFRAEGGTAR